jgi:hypothetical protein
MRLHEEVAQQEPCSASAKAENTQFDHSRPRENVDHYERTSAMSHDEPTL